jgi:hypothetical protein
MSIDLEQSYSEFNSKVSAAKTYVEVRQSENELNKEVRNNLEQAQQKTTTQVDQLKEQQKRYQRQMKTQLDHMISMVQFNSGSGSATLRYIKQKFIEAALKIEPLIFNVLNTETINALGCSQQQAYSAQSIYIKVASTDLTGLLKSNPNETWARAAYEKLPPSTNQIPYSMNRQMWERLQNVNVPIDYYGASGQKLFTITYVTFDGSITGNFYKIDLVDRVTGLNKVSNFIFDYYKSIKIIDLSNLFQTLIDLMSGAISFEAKIGYGELQTKNQFLLILQRILGLCFDSKREIDVSGISKIAELDNIDQSFYEFTDIDLRMIDDTIWNIQNGVIEFEDCQNVKLPINTKDLIDAVNYFNDITKIDDITAHANNLTNILSQNEAWGPMIPTSVDINLSIDLSFLLNLPKAIMVSLLSPKVILPLLIMAKAINQMSGYAIDNLMDFMKQFSRYCINIMSKIGAIFVEQLFELIKKDILLLVSAITADLAKEKALKKYAMIVKLVQLILIVAKLVDDWRKCKSVVDELLALLTLVSKSFGNNIPLPLLAASSMLDGYSATRAFINHIENLQKLGLPTGPMPDGSPNLMLQANNSQIRAQAQEQFENGVAEVFIPSLTITPAGTIPARGSGKYH